MIKLGERYSLSVRKMFERAGVYVRKSKHYWPLDRSSLTWTHPLNAIYANNSGNLLLTAPLERILTLDLHAFLAQRDDDSPFVKTVVDYLEGRCVTYSGSALQSFYDSCNFRTAADFLQLPNPSNSRLEDLPVAAGVPPWRTTPPDEMPKRRFAKILRENREHGHTELTVSDGHSLYGPVTRKKGELEFARLVSITEKIKKYGWRTDRRGIDNIAVTLLSAEDDDYRFVVSGAGQHRIAALAALEYKHAVVQIQADQPLNGVVRRVEACRWPLVQQGWFNEAEAVCIFDRFFAS